MKYIIKHIIVITIKERRDVVVAKSKPTWPGLRK